MKMGGVPEEQRKFLHFALYSQSGIAIGLAILLAKHFGAPTVVDGVVYFANRQHRIYALNARTGRQVTRWPDGAFVPVAGNGRLLLLHGFSRLYAMAPKSRQR